MAVGLAAFTVVRLAVTMWVRPHFLPPMTTILPPSAVGPGGVPAINGSSVTDTGGWVLSDRLVGNGPTLREVVVSQPGARFWTFQKMESDLFLLLTAGCAALAFYWLRNRIA
jgi:hypothetical protein